MAGMAAALALMAGSASAALSAPMILNEYNAVKDGGFLKDSGSDTYFGTVAGNGGDWMEFVVTQDKLDIRGWSFVTYQNGAYDGTVTLPSLDALASLRSGTIFTIAEQVATDLSYNPVYDPSNPNAGDWWMNYQASFSAGNATHSNFQVTIADALNNTVFGPAGEGISPASGIGNDEVFKLEADPSSSIEANSSHYNDGTSSSFGSPNRWSSGTITQDFSKLRSAAAVASVPEPSSLMALVYGGLGALAFVRRRKVS
jgi:hypothetical protein